MKSHLLDTKWEYHAGIPTLTGTLSGSNNHAIALARTGSGNRKILQASQTLVQYWQPNVCLLTGIACGLKDADFGDIVIGTKAYGIMSGKQTTDGFVSRPAVVPYSPDLIRISKKLGSCQDWWNRLNGVDYQPKVILPPLNK